MRVRKIVFGKHKKPLYQSFWINFFIFFNVTTKSLGIKLIECFAQSPPYLYTRWVDVSIEKSNVTADLYYPIVMADKMLNTEEIERVKHKLIEWDNLKNPKAPLSESQLLAIEKIAEAVKYQPLPVEVS